MLNSNLDLICGSSVGPQGDAICTYVSTPQAWLDRCSQTSKVGLRLDSEGGDICHPRFASGKYWCFDSNVGYVQGVRDKGAGARDGDVGIPICVSICESGCVVQSVIQYLLQYSVRQGIHLSFNIMRQIHGK